MSRRRVLVKKDKIDKCVYAFWTGSNKMSEDRKKCLTSLEQNFSSQGINFVLVDNTNIGEYILKSGEPLHEGYQYLSETGKADYLRCYFMHFFGGGYTDIKLANGDWKKVFLSLEIDEKKFCSGYREERPEDVAVVFDENWNLKREESIQLRQNYHKLLGMCCFIFKKRTAITTEWYRELIKTLDRNLEQLRRYPAKSPQQNINGIDSSYPHPIPWVGILGSILHPLFLKYSSRLDYSLPKFQNGNYR